LSQSILRKENYIKQVKGSFIFKVGAIASTFIAMPIMIRYLGAELFGIWSTMLMLISWVMMFDLGIGNGLKNKISESLAKNNTEEAVGYISTAYGIIGLVSIALFLCLFVVSYFIPWESVFNTSAVSGGELRTAIISLSFFVFFNFWLSLVNQVYHGLQKSSFVTFGQFLSNTIALTFVIFLYHFHDSSLTKMVVAYGFALVISNLVLSFLIFSSYKDLRPLLKLFNVSKLKPLLSLGARFFIIQIAVIVIFMTDKIIITQLLGPEKVTSYDVVFKLFSVFSVVHSLVLLPIWPAYSNAYSQGDFPWIRNALKNQLKFSLFIFLGALGLAALGPTIVKIWIGDEVQVDSTLYFAFFSFVVVSVWSNVFAYFVNSINKINIQVITSIFSAVINIPMSIFFVSYLDLGLNGIVMATTLSLSIYAVIGPFQVIKLVRQ